MIGSNNYADNVTPTIILTDELFNDNVHNQSALTLDTDEQNNNYPIIESPIVDYCQRNDQFNGNFMCLSNDVINLHDIPISALRAKSRDLLSKRLNAIKVILSEDGAPRDWRGVLNGIGQSDAVNTVQLKGDPMKEVLDLWANKNINATIGELQRILGVIDRWDVVDDTSDFFFEDSKYFLETSLKKKNNDVNSQRHQTENEENVTYDDSNLLTFDDIALKNQGKGPQRYHAYVLFDDSDINFATQILEQLEMKGLKLCSKERDLIGGTIEMDAIMRVISERCERLIVIFSNAFFHSAANTFFVKFAQAIGIEQRMRKIIPCMKDNCMLPPELRFYYVLRYTEKKTYYNFWDRLASSIQEISIVRTPSPAIMPRITITEIDSPSSVKSNESQLHPKPATQSNSHFETPNALSIKPNQSKSSKSSPTTPISLKKLWNNIPKTTISSSTWTIGVSEQMFDKENERSHSSLSLNNSATPTKFKKTKPFGFVKKWLSPGSDYKLSVESDSSVGADNTTKKKKWYRKRFRNHSKNRETANEV